MANNTDPTYWNTMQDYYNRVGSGLRSADKTLAPYYNTLDNASMTQQAFNQNPMYGTLYGIGNLYPNLQNIFPSLQNPNQNSTLQNTNYYGVPLARGGADLMESYYGLRNNNFFNGYRNLLTGYNQIQGVFPESLPAIPRNYYPELQAGGTALGAVDTFRALRDKDYGRAFASGLNTYNMGKAAYNSFYPSTPQAPTAQGNVQQTSTAQPNSAQSKNNNTVDGNSSSTTAGIAQAGAGGYDAYSGYERFKDGDKVGGSLQMTRGAANAYAGGAKAAGYSTGTGTAGTVAMYANVALNAYDTYKNMERAKGTEAKGTAGAVGAGKIAADWFSFGLGSTAISYFEKQWGGTTEKIQKHLYDTDPTYTAKIIGKIQSGKDNKQAARDTFRELLQKSKVVGDKYELKFSDGAEIDLGKDGSKLGKIDFEKDGDTVALANVLSRSLGFKKDVAEQTAHLIALSSIEGTNGDKTKQIQRIKEWADKLGIDPDQGAYIIKGMVNDKSKTMKKEDADVYLNDMAKIFGRTGDDKVGADKFRKQEEMRLIFAKAKADKKDVSKLTKEDFEKYKLTPEEAEKLDKRVYSDYPTGDKAPSRQGPSNVDPNSDIGRQADEQLDKENQPPGRQGPIDVDPNSDIGKKAFEEYRKKNGRQGVSNVDPNSKITKQANFKNTKELERQILQQGNLSGNVPQNNDRGRLIQQNQRLVSKKLLLNPNQQIAILSQMGLIPIDYNQGSVNRSNNGILPPNTRGNNNRIGIVDREQR